jgi:hypothetical protein
MSMNTGWRGSFDFDLPGCLAQAHSQRSGAEGGTGERTHSQRSGAEGVTGERTIVRTWKLVPLSIEAVSSFAIVGVAFRR